MALTTESLTFDCLFDYKQIKLTKKDWLISPVFYSSTKNTTWCLQIDRSNSKTVGIYLTLINGAPCTLHSYTLSMMTNKQPCLIMFNNRCTQQRIFPSNDFSWGFEKFCTRRELKDERDLIRDPKTKLINVRCIMNIQILNPNHLNDDHRLATDLFHTHSLEQWIEYLKERDDLSELNNRVNEEIERRLNI